MPVTGATELTGSATGATVQYLTLLQGKIVSSEQISDILIARSNAGAPVEINHMAVSHLLHDGFVPQPYTVYQDIFGISIGITATIREGSLAFHQDFPFSLIQSRRDGEPSVDRLLDLLAKATDAACQASNNAVLLLSAGLDSTSLALAVKQLGRSDVCAVTYGEPDQQSEVALAQNICRRIGLRHETHILDTAAPQTCRDLIAYARSVPEPCADPALTACVSAVRAHADRNTVVLDGSGSDYYFWCPPRPMDLFKLRLGLSRSPFLGQIRQWLPMYLPHERLLSTPLEPFLLHGSWLRHCDTRRFYSASVNTHDLWLKEYHLQKSLPPQEARYRNRAIYVGPGAHMKKTRNATFAVGARIGFPWASPAVAEYCFNLPEQDRFDRKSRKSKIIVREMLRSALGYDDEVIGKRPFLFGKRRFLENHLSFCREEILNCALWSKGIEAEFGKLSYMFRCGHATENALFSLLMVSLWHNHWVCGAMEQISKPAQLRQAV